MSAESRRPERAAKALSSEGEAELRCDAARDLAGCLPHLCEGDRRLLSVVCGVLMEVEAEQDPSAAMAVLEQMAMVVGARRPGDG